MATKKNGNVLDKVVSVPITELAMSWSWNYRFKNNMDIAAMVDDIVRHGGIPHPCLVFIPTKFDAEGKSIGVDDAFYSRNGIEPGLKVRVQGHRRTEAAWYIITHPAEFSHELVEACKHIPCYVRHIEEGEAEELVFDQGAAKPVSKAEVVNAIYRLYDRGYSEIEVTSKLYQQLGTILFDDANKVRAYSALPIGSTERTDYIREWLHTKVGSYYIKAKKLGPWVADQVLLLFKQGEKLLDEGEVLDVEITTGLMNKLSKAWQRDLKEVDKETKEPRVVTWNGPVADVKVTTDENDKVKVEIEGGGLYFNELLEQYIIAHKDPSSAKAAKAKASEAEGPKMMTKKALEGRKDSYISDAVKNTIAVVLGERDVNLNAIDLESYRVEKVFAALEELEKAADDESLAKFLRAIRLDKATEVLEAAATIGIYTKPNGPDACDLSGVPCEAELAEEVNLKAASEA